MNFDGNDVNDLPSRGRNSAFCFLWTFYCRPSHTQYNEEYLSPAFCRTETETRSIREIRDAEDSWATSKAKRTPGSGIFAEGVVRSNVGTYRWKRAMFDPDESSSKRFRDVGLSGARARPRKRRV